MAEARPLIGRLVSIDPPTPLTRCMPGWADALEGDFAAATGPYRDMFAMDRGNPVARLFYLYMLAAAGDADEALRIAAAVPDAARSSPPGQVTGLFASALAGRRPLQLAGEHAQALARSTDMFPRFLAQAFALAGDTGNAVKWASVAVDKGFINYPFLARHDPFLASLVGISAYDALLKIVRSRREAFRP